MKLRDHMERSGNWLFRYRSFLPFFVTPLIVGEINAFGYLGNSHTSNEYWQLICLLVSLFGLLLRALIVGYVPVGTSGRNTHGQVAQSLNTTGVYSLVRHPLYLANYIILLGFLLFFHSPYLVLLMTCLFALYYERIMFAEDSFLQSRFGETFERWAAVTPSFIPAIHRWKRPDLPFSWRSVLRREYSGLFLITTVHSVLDIIGDSHVERRLWIDWKWCAVALCGLAIYLTLRTLKKHSRVLSVAGR